MKKPSVKVIVTLSVLGGITMSLLAGFLIMKLIWTNGESFKDNYFVAGTFYASREEKMYTLEVSEIDESEFFSREGKNVVKDLATQRYFLLDLFDGSRSTGKHYTFESLNERGITYKKAPFYYDDINGSTIEPLFRLGDGVSQSLEKYVINMPKEGLDYLFFYDSTSYLKTGNS